MEKVSVYGYANVGRNYQAAHFELRDDPALLNVSGAFHRKVPLGKNQRRAGQTECRVSEAGC